VPKVDALHGETRVDDYHWLRERENPEVRAYLEAENLYAEAVVAPLHELRERLYDEMLGRIKETDLSVPYRQAGSWWYTRTEQGKQYAIRCRRRGSPDAPEEVVLDLNALAEGHPFLGLGAFEPSDDARLLGYTLDTTGYRQFTLAIKDLESGELLPERVERVTSLAFARDGATLFYTVEDGATKRSYRLYRHRLGSVGGDELVYEEADERFSVGVHRTRSGAFLVLTSSSHTASEVRVLPASEPSMAWRLVAPRREEHEYYLDHRQDLFYIRTNRDALGFRIVTAPVDDPSRWSELVPHRTGVMIEDHDLFARHMVLLELEGGLPYLSVHDLEAAEGAASHRVAFPEPTYSVYGATNREFENTVFRYGYESMVTPRSIYDYHLDSRESVLLKRVEVLGGYDPAGYTSERTFAAAADGTLVPVSLVYRNGLVKDGRAPCFLSGYGSYGYPNFAGFDSNAISLLDRGFVMAEAHIRGGGELGKAWHDGGRMAQKRNTFTDFIAAAEHLIAHGYTASERLVIGGRSAGGLLIGAVVNLRPELFRAALLWVPFVDVINTMRDTSLPLTIGEFEEWGNPEVEEHYRLMRSYCPYTNLAGSRYPWMLVKTAFNDSQVMYWEPAKYVAKLRTLKQGDEPLLFVTNMGAGHGGASGRYDALREAAFDASFILWAVGIEN